MVEKVFLDRLRCQVMLSPAHLTRKATTSRMRRTGTATGTATFFLNMEMTSFICFLG